MPGSLDLPDMVKQPPARLPVPAGLATAASGGLSGVAPAADQSGQGRRESVGAPAAVAAARQSLAGAEGSGTLSDRWGLQTGHQHARAGLAPTHMRLAGLKLTVLHSWVCWFACTSPADGAGCVSVPASARPFVFWPLTVSACMSALATPCSIDTHSCALCATMKSNPALSG